MGCQTTTAREGGGGASLDGRPHINPAHLPAVPADSWYATPFTEDTPMELTGFHAKRKGEVVFATKQIPTRAIEFAQLDTQNREPATSNTFQLGVDPIYGMGYLHNTALYIEHYWRTRVNHSFAGDSKFDRPFYNMLLGVKVFINNELVPDQAPGPDSLLQCTATIRAHEATSTWLCLPIILFPTGGTIENNPLLSVVEVYRGLCLSFSLAAQTLLPGNHTVRVEVVYGCRAEQNFCTDFIARGSFTLVVADGATDKLSRVVNELASMIQSHAAISANSPTGLQRETVIPNRALSASAAASRPCPFCSAPLRYVCTICSAHVCGSSSCVWSKFGGYPYGCQTHKAQF